MVGLAPAELEALHPGTSLASPAAASPRHGLSSPWESCQGAWGENWALVFFKSVPDYADYQSGLRPTPQFFLTAPALATLP